MRDGHPHARRRHLAIALALLGALICVYLEVLHVQTYLGLGGTGYCEAGERVSCMSVALSGASVLLGVPLPVWGFAGFLALLLSSWRGSRLQLWLATIASAASLALLGYELVAVGSICMWCEAIHAIAFGLFGLAWLDRKAALPKPTPKSALIELGPSAALMIAAAALTPAYWMTATWSSGARLPHGFDENGRPWLGAETPELVVHEYVDYACPHCRIASARMKMRLASDSGLRVVRHQQPRMRCGTEASQGARCSFARAAICAGDQGRFWEMDDWLFHHSGGSSMVDAAQAAEDVGLDLDTLRTCMESAAAHARAQADVDEAQQWGIRGTPGYVVDGRRVDLDELRQVLARR